MMRIMRVGSQRGVSNVSEEYLRIAKEDEDAANSLAASGLYRHALCLLIQAMEKLIRAKIFSIVNSDLAELRDINKSHSLDLAVDHLLEVISTEDIVRRHVRRQMRQYALGDILYGDLHNDLRYPYYRKDRKSFTVLAVTKVDFEEMSSRLAALRRFLGDLHLLG